MELADDPPSGRGRYVGRTQTRSTVKGETCFTHRLVGSERDGKKVRAATVLHPGRLFPVAQDHRPVPCAPVEKLVYGQGALQAAPSLGAEISAPADVRSVDVDALERNGWHYGRCRQWGLWNCGWGWVFQVWCGRRFGDRSSLAWLRRARSGRRGAGWRNAAALGRCSRWIEGLAENALHRASGVLMKHRSTIEDALFRQISGLFGLQTSVTLYDLTESHFEWDGPLNPKARRGHSEDKRTDYPW
jgi:hypothetical protein